MLGRLIIYCKDVPDLASFYETHFGFTRLQRPDDRILELRHPDGGAAILLHKAAKSQKMGQVLVKLTMDIADVPAKRAALIEAGLKVGPVLDGGGYQFANLKDPSGNSVCLSGRYRVAEDAIST